MSQNLTIEELRLQLQQARQEAERERTARVNTAMMMAQQVSLAEAARDEARAALQQAREALKQFGQHHDHCTHTLGMLDVPCTCGLDAALQDEGR